VTESLVKCKSCDGYGGYAANVFSPSYLTEVKCPVCKGTGLDPSVEVVYGEAIERIEAPSRD
jgi:DnaJ-class molecular chaperone